MEVDYYSKYLKYKAKYLELKNQMGGTDNEYGTTACCKSCNCINYKFETQNGSYFMCSCSHLKTSHSFLKTDCTKKNVATKCCSCNCAEFKVYVNNKNEKNPDKCACTHPLANHLDKKKKECDKLS
jgi:hypothetical protein